MSKNAVKEKLLQVWEQVVLAHKVWKENPSAQCAWTLIKLLVWLLFQLVKLRLMPH